MDEKQAVTVLHEALERVYRSGFIIKGRLEFMRPRMPGISQSTVRAQHQDLRGENDPTPCINTEMVISVERSQPPPMVIDTSPPDGPPPKTDMTLAQAEAVMVAASVHQAHAQLTVTGPAPEAMGYTGQVCSNCGGSKVMRAGTCGTCTECGTTTGCS